MSVHNELQSEQHARATITIRLHFACIGEDIDVFAGVAPVI